MRASKQGSLQMQVSNKVHLFWLLRGSTYFGRHRGYEQGQQTCTQTVGADNPNVPCLQMQGRLAEGRTMCYINQDAATQTEPVPITANTNRSQTGLVPIAAYGCHVVCRPCAVVGTGFVWNRLLLIMVSTGSVLGEIGVAPCCSFPTGLQPPGANSLSLPARESPEGKAMCYMTQVQLSDMENILH